jgi:hypothetical protein
VIHSNLVPVALSEVAYLDHVVPSPVRLPPLL